MKNTTYHLMVLQPAPSMNQRKIVFQASSYAAAVNRCQDEWLAGGRSVTLHSGEWDMHYWHRVDSDGVFEDRSKTTGVETSGRLVRPAQARA